jgi:homopolymeric O-antigen transport system permease protein
LRNGCDHVSSAPPAATSNPSDGELGVTPQYARALEDVYAGAGNWLMWSRLGWLEIRRRYRRTLMGPFWTSFNVAVMVFSMGFLWAALFGQPVSSYMPYLTAGIVTWHLVASFLLEGANVFTSNAGLLTTVRLPQTLLVTTMVWRNVLVFFHNAMVFVIVMAIWKVPVTWNTLLVIPGLVLLALNGLWAGILLGIVGTRFRDMPQLLAGIVQIMMFLTPIMWSRDILKGREAISYVIDVNPFYHAVEVVRAPLLGQAPHLLSWIVVLLMIPCGALFTLYVFSRFRQRVVYWL